MSQPVYAKLNLLAGFFYREAYIEYMDTTSKFAHLQYHVLHKLEVSINEYWLLDMVYQLSRNGMCYKSLESIANDMRLTKNGVVKMRDRLIERKLIIKDDKGRMKTSVMYNSVYQVDEKTYNSVQNRTTKYNGTVQLSGTKNNSKNNKEKGMDNFNEKKDHKGEVSPAKERIRELVKSGRLKELKNA